MVIKSGDKQQSIKGQARVPRVQFTFFIPIPMDRQLRVLAAERDRTITGLILDAIRNTYGNPSEVDNG